MIEIIAISCLACIIAEFSGIMQWIKWKWNRIMGNLNPCNPKFIIKRLKPFDCEKCMGWWLGLIYFYIRTNDIITAILCGAICSVLSIYIVKYAK